MPLLTATLAFSLALLWLSLPAWAASPVASRDGGQEGFVKQVPGVKVGPAYGEETPTRLIARRRPHTGGKPPDGLTESLGLRRVRSMPSLGLEVLELPPDPILNARPGEERLAGHRRQAVLAETLQRMREEGDFAWVEVDERIPLTLTPNDTHYQSQWGPARVGLERAWEHGQGSPQVVLALIDTGVAREIPDFAGRLVSPYSAEYETSAWPAWEDVVGHGSGTAGVAAATGNDGGGIAGAAWATGIMPVHVTDQFDASVSVLAGGILWAVDNGADVINISFGSSQPHQAMKEAIDYALSRGVVVVAAAGNSGASGITYPAAFPGVIAVGATNRLDKRPGFSSRGPALDLAAPGAGVLTWQADRNSYWLANLDGTSFAAPLVAGAAALLLSLDPSLTPLQIEDLLEATADDLGSPGWDDEFGSGILDTAEAVVRVRPPTTTTLLPTTTTLPPTTTTLPSTTTSSPSTTTTTLPPPAFLDTPATHPYFPAIQGMAGQGIIAGYPTSSGVEFRPESPVMRAQFAKMIDGVLALDVREDATGPFTDLGPDDPASLYPHEYVAVAAAYGITRGTTASTFSPWRDVSRAQAVTMIVRAWKALRPAALNPVPAGFAGSLGAFSPDHAEAMRVAEFNGLLAGLVGFSSTWDPWAPATRGEAAQLLWTAAGAEGLALPR